MFRAGIKRSQKGAKGSQREPKVSQGEPKVSQGEPKVSQREPKVSQSSTKMHNKVDVWKRSRKGAKRIRVSFAGPFWEPFSIKNAIENSFKNRSRKNMENIQKGSQNGIEIDAKTHKKSMPKLESRKDQENHEISCFSERAKP